MRKNFFTNIFILFLITLIMSGCRPLNKEGGYSGTVRRDDSAKSQEINLIPQLIDAYSQLIQSEEDDEVNGDGQKNLQSDKEKKELIALIKEKVKTEIEVLKKYSNKIEDNEQYGMKWGVFKFLIEDKNKRNIQAVENMPARKQLYASLEWNEDRLRKFGTIMNEVEKCDRVVATTILETGMNFVQGKFENAIISIDDKDQDLDNLILNELKDIKKNLDLIDNFRKQWISSIDKIIAEYDSNTGDIQKDSQALVKRVNSEYKEIFENEIPEIKKASDDIQTILK
ncbi:complement regulator-acquiring protein [Borrelia crocidurae]|uniref:Antigen P35-like protein, lipoprotein n=1 Tax=Borrelia crocidurae (strain Achema) TaxID=1155096 RepID=I0FE10_BORCA|nr:complement regulator-acquiring protein [Borrelia crocidurae]AFI31716.1 Antigen P35-like protein, lipoprotein [Borrelia crocidurae str. Achema]